MRGPKHSVSDRMTRRRSLTHMLHRCRSISAYVLLVTLDAEFSCTNVIQPESLDPLRWGHKTRSRAGKQNHMLALTF